MKVLVRDQILQAAEDVFAAQGLLVARMEEIAARAGVAVGTVYNYFSDRQALLSAVLDERTRELATKLKALERQTRGQPFETRVEAFLRELLGHFDAQRALYSLLLQAECSPSQRLIHTHRDGPFAEIYRQAERLVAEGMREGTLRDESAEFLAAMLVGMVKGTAIRALIDPKMPTVSGRLPQILSLFLRGAER
ncbi:MAG: TetR/AcrR family transcriptional regulator [Deltaproteobacteria bacterium]